LLTPSFCSRPTCSLFSCILPSFVSPHFFFPGFFPRTNFLVFFPRENLLPPREIFTAGALSAPSLSRFLLHLFPGPFSDSRFLSHFGTVFSKISRFDRSSPPSISCRLDTLTQTTTTMRFLSLLPHLPPPLPRCCFCSFLEAPLCFPLFGLNLICC